MKISSKSVSSPSRAEKFPPPLLMFLRSNGGSRSRGRSRASPMFYLRSKKNAAAIEAAIEPSSPKVTCIGQVRVKRSSKSSRPKKTGGATTTSCLCWWFKKIDFHNFTSGFHKPEPLRRFFIKCGLFSRSECCKKSDTGEDSFGVEPIQTSQNIQNHIGTNCEILGPQFQENNVDFLGSTTPHVGTNEILGTQIQENIVDFLGSSSPHVDNNHEILEAQIQENKGNFLDSSSPPKNAFLLTRCRSTPCRSSSLASRFRGSAPLATPETENNTDKEAKTKHEFRELKNPRENVAVESRNNHEVENFEGSVNNVTKLNSTVGGVASHPLLLTRSKSEPARTAERLMPEANLWRQRRLSVVESCSQN
ncbi:uncharacterized protein LOC111386180 [Olea europaea var. sylvestris]|uniref:Uncharacterized protein n=1 Tax=Olea europaea subsp. europaea TaxID=158383 RepID=A0A8S0R1P5_OLEEU|nr:uncharacterized protein LOC111386180 [Olea europaea var. sylvestris]CAA2972368.1 Hypothetical predicted protein [Olea europaea subsp. europaea]